MTPATFISIVVPVRNEAYFIQRTLEQLRAQDYDPDRFEILVVDGESTDGTVELVERMMAADPRIKLLRNPRRLSSAARNIGIRNARGKLIVIVDGHVDIDNRSYLRELANAFSRSGAHCLGRPQPLDAAGLSTFQQAIAAARGSWLGHHPASFVYSSSEKFVPPDSVAVAYRRAVFDTVGFFDETFDACEDVEFNHRVGKAGLICFFTPRILARYFPRADVRGLFRQMVRYGRGRARLLFKHPDTLSIGTLIPAFFILGLAAGLITSCFSNRALLFYSLALGLYLSVVVADSLRISFGRRKIRLMPWLVCAFVAIHIACGIGVWLETLVNLRLRSYSWPDAAGQTT